MAAPLRQTDEPVLTMRCPSCGTGYRLPASMAIDMPATRCARCANVWTPEEFSSLPHPARADERAETPAADRSTDASDDVVMEDDADADRPEDAHAQDAHAQDDRTQDDRTVDAPKDAERTEDDPFDGALSDDASSHVESSEIDSAFDAAAIADALTADSARARDEARSDGANEAEPDLSSGTADAPASQEDIDALMSDAGEGESEDQDQGQGQDEDDDDYDDRAPETRPADDDAATRSDVETANDETSGETIDLEGARTDAPLGGTDGIDAPTAETRDAAPDDAATEADAAAPEAFETPSPTEDDPMTSDTEIDPMRRRDEAPLTDLTDLDRASTGARGRARPIGGGSSRRAARGAALAVIAGSAALGAAVLTLPERVVAAEPRMNALYAALGMPVNLTPFTLAAETARLSTRDDRNRLSLDVTLANLGETPQPLPALSFTLLDADGRAIATRPLSVPTKILDGLGRISFEAGAEIEAIDGLERVADVRVTLTEAPLHRAALARMQHVGRLK